MHLKESRILLWKITSQVRRRGDINKEPSYLSSSIISMHLPSSSSSMHLTPGKLVHAFSPHMSPVASSVVSYAPSHTLLSLKPNQ
ncbi:hypothetical protein MUK42_32997 [Musa troglodytarum]|uniref:Uncharacterized protein n=1 Tax=Musa troglodytarum TaxID=320322 RepID=A0A9E7F6L0_9LILI|nr:hypothetical protein MUK42_32997 [Musa troglodytarum]